jgi:hypothetical protein
LRKKIFIKSQKYPKSGYIKELFVKNIHFIHIPQEY